MLVFPSIAETEEMHDIISPFGHRLFKRAVGDVLHPERESEATLRHIREAVGEYNFAAQYQQNPTPLGGAIIRTAWLRYYEPGDRPERFIQTVQSWDTANKATELSDYSVCTTWGVYENRYYLLDVFRQRLNYPDLKRKLRELAWRDRPNKILIEDKASGTQLIQELKNEGLFAVKPFLPPAPNIVVRKRSLYLRKSPKSNAKAFAGTAADSSTPYTSGREIFGCPTARQSVIMSAVL